MQSIFAKLIQWFGPMALKEVLNFFRNLVMDLWNDFWRRRREKELNQEIKNHIEKGEYDEAARKNNELLNGFRSAK